MKRTVQVLLLVDTDLPGVDLERAITEALDLDDLDGSGFGDGVSLIGYVVDTLDRDEPVSEVPGAPLEPPSQSTKPCASREHIEDMDRPGVCLWCNQPIVREGGAWVVRADA